MLSVFYIIKSHSTWSANIKNIRKVKVHSATSRICRLKDWCVTGSVVNLEITILISFLSIIFLIYIDTVGAVVHSTTFDRWATVRQQQQFKALSPFLESLFAVPATLAPVERVFSYGGLYMRPHRARMSDHCSLVC